MTSILSTPEVGLKFLNKEKRGYFEKMIFHPPPLFLPKQKKSEKMNKLDLKANNCSPINSPSHSSCLFSNLLPPGPSSLFFNSFCNTAATGGKKEKTRGGTSSPNKAPIQQLFSSQCLCVISQFKAHKHQTTNAGSSSLCTTQVPLGPWLFRAEWVQVSTHTLCSHPTWALGMGSGLTVWH